MKPLGQTPPPGAQSGAHDIALPPMPGRLTQSSPALQFAVEVHAAHESEVSMTHLLPLHWPEQQSLLATQALLPQTQRPEVQ